MSTIIKIELIQEEMPKPVVKPSLYARVCQLVKRLENREDTERSQQVWRRLKIIYQIVKQKSYTHPDKQQILEKLKPVIQEGLQYDPNGIEV